MSPHPLEFVVDYCDSGESGRFTVIGRCGQVPIRVNELFDAVYRNRPRRYPDELGDEPIREVEEPASLRVECIHAYEKSLPMLGQGMTGSLVLRGEGMDHVAPGWILGRRSDSRILDVGDHDSTDEQGN